MPAAYGVDGESIEPRRIYIAPPDHHLLIDDGLIRLGRGPRENGSRPAVDPLFRSAARWYGSRAIGVVLSGSLHDGTSGMAAIKAQGGVTIVQDPHEAVCRSMPRNALENVAIDHVVGAAELPMLLHKLVADPARPNAAPRASAANARELEAEISVAQNGVPDEEPAAQDHGSPSAFACPDCHGVLWEIKQGDLIRFRCRVGHAYLPDALAQAQSKELEEALWTALRSLRESTALATRLAEHARQRKLSLVAAAHDERAREARKRAQAIEAVLQQGELYAAAPEAEIDSATSRMERNEG
jgi:two-component system chemotaxis response regulator CheB